jgi:hypothetical protein
MKIVIAILMIVLMATMAEGQTMIDTVYMDSAYRKNIVDTAYWDSLSNILANSRTSSPDSVPILKTVDDSIQQSNNSISRKLFWGIYTRKGEVQTDTSKIIFKCYDSVWISFSGWDNSWDYRITVPIEEIIRDTSYFFYYKDYDDKITICDQTWIVGEHHITYRMDTLSIWKIKRIK